MVVLLQDIVYTNYGGIWVLLSRITAYFKHDGNTGNKKKRQKLLKFQLGVAINGQKMLILNFPK